jgi:hypothetical protein
MLPSGFCRRRAGLSCAGRDRTDDLRVMDPASYLAAPPREIRIAPRSDGSGEADAANERMAQALDRLLDRVLMALLNLGQRVAMDLPVEPFDHVLGVAGVAVKELMRDHDVGLLRVPGLELGAELDPGFVAVRVSLDLGEGLFVGGLVLELDPPAREPEAGLPDREDPFELLPRQRATCGRRRGADPSLTRACDPADPSPDRSARAAG